MKTKIAKDLLKIQAVFLRPDEPFTWASGIKSPIYCDNRLTLSDHQVRLDVENGLAELVKTHYPEAEALMGTSTAGIAHAAITAHLLALPMGYVRSGAKDHGRKNQIEGKLVPGQKVVVIEDLISTGGSVLEVVEVLRQAGAEGISGQKTRRGCWLSGTTPPIPVGFRSNRLAQPCLCLTVNRKEGAVYEARSD